MNLRYTTRARRHVGAIFEYLNEHSSEAAWKVVSRIRQTAELLIDFPFLGHEGAVEGTREIVVRDVPYIVAYRVVFGRRDYVEILSVLHAAQDRQ